MTPEQKAAFINAQCALVNAKIASMQAANLTYNPKYGGPPKYVEEDFLRESQEAVLGWNAVISFFQD